MRYKDLEDFEREVEELKKALGEEGVDFIEIDPREVLDGSLMLRLSEEDLVWSERPRGEPDGP